MENGKGWTDADFRSFDSWKRLEEKINCMNAITAYRMSMEKLRELGILWKSVLAVARRFPQEGGKA